MTGEIAALAFDLVILALFGALLAALLWAAHWGVSLLPTSKERRSQISRATPVIATVVALGYVLLAARTLFRSHPAYSPLVLALVVAGFVGAAWPSMRDFLAGVALRSSRVCQTGDYVRIGDVTGRITSMGYRVLSIETTGGDEAIIPYASIARDAVIRTRSLGGVCPHRFRIKAPPKLAFADARERIAEAAMLCHWSAFVREPEITPDADELDITVFALDSAHGPEIEALVRKRLHVATPRDKQSELARPS
jgi:small-conductance mechanosensitive channel